MSLSFAKFASARTFLYKTQSINILYKTKTDNDGNTTGSKAKMKDIVSVSTDE